MNQSSSNSSMSRSTAETLKQIQKQGLSISIISGDNSKTFPLETASKETRDKQNAVAIENLVSTSRTAISAESKPTVSQARHISNASVETRASSAQSALPANQAVQPGTVKTNPTVSASSEIKAPNSQRINNPNSVESKNQFPLSNRIAQIDKNETSTGRLSQNSSFSEKKIPNRSSQNVSNVIETKTPIRNSQTEPKTQTHSRIQNQSLVTDSKANTNLGRLSVSSPPLEGKTLSNQGRLNQTPVHDKSIGGQRNQLLITDFKAANSQCKIIPVRQNDTRILGTPKGHQNVKLIPRVISQYQPIPSQPSSISNNNKSVDKSSVNALSERSLNNPFRVASTLTKNVPEEKPVFKVTRLSQNIAAAENQSVQSKISQHISLKTENKAISQVIKISELSSELHRRPLPSENTSEILSPRVNTMPIQKTGVKRVALNTSTPISTGKRKCVKIVSPNISDQSGSQSDVNTLSSDESPVKEKKVFNLKTLTPGLTITPIQPATSTPSTSGSATVAEANRNLIVICPSCKQCSLNLSTCDSCHEKITPPLRRYQFKQPDSASIVVTQNVTTSIEKSMQIVYHQSFQFQQSQQVIKVSPKRGRPKRRKFVEPVCYTLSSDDDEAVPFESVHEEGSSSQLLYPLESEGSKSEHSSTSDLMQDENQDFDDLHYPGVTSIGSKQQVNANNNEEEEEEEEEEDLEQEMESEDEMMEEEEEQPEFEGDEEEFEEELEEEEDEEIPPDEEEGLLVYNKMQSCTASIVLKCRSIRIGSYKIHPEQHTNYIDVKLTDKSISFLAPLVTDGKKCILLTLRASETAQMWIHFGKCLPIIFAYTSRHFGEAVRKALNMTKSSPILFDPTSDDMRKNKLTFLIDTLSEEQRAFMRQIFPGQEKLKEIDQKEANEILVKSTPQQNLIKIESSDSHTMNVSTLPSVPVTGVIPANLSSQQSLSITKVLVKPSPPIPVTKILTYPPPPQTGGIAINTADLATLEEGEFLNDAILDFYLKYVFYEKLSARDREKTHIFSSFFYPRLTQKPDRQRPGDDAPKTVQVRRHNQVKTWTKHVDIFSKDYIIIPVNQHNHWFLAFICYPGHVPDMPIVKTELKSSKCADVTSTDDQESSKVIIREEISNSEDMQNQDENSTNSNSLYEVEEPPDSDDEASSEIPDSSTHPDGSVIFHESNYQRKETPCILIFDSLSGPNRWRIASTLREYLEMEWKIRKGTKKVFDRNTMQGFIVKCPQQTNFSDCGLYVLQYVESFFENPIPYFANPMPDLKNWFSDAKIAKKRQQLKELILNLQKQNQIKQVGISIRKVNQSSVSSPSITTPQSDNR